MKMKTLAQVNSKANYSFDPVDVASCPPEVLSRVTRCISIWSMIEAFTANVALYAVKGDIRVAMEMYASIKSSGAASAALNTAVRMGLEPKYAKVRKVPTGDNALISYRKEMSVAEQPRGIRIKARGGFEA
jgi:hypothetical protein